MKKFDTFNFKMKLKNRKNDEGKEVHKNVKECGF